MILFLFIACICVSIWGSTPALVEAKQRYPQKDALSIKFLVGDCVWSDAAPKPIRRKYAVSHMSMAIGFLTLGQLVRNYEKNSDKRVGAIVIGGVFAIITAIQTMRKVYKHGL